MVKTYPTLKIENIVASGIIAKDINLAEISSKIEGCELNTKRFPGAIEFNEIGDAKRDVAYVKQVDNATGKWKFIAVQKAN